MLDYESIIENQFLDQKIIDDYEDRIMYDIAETFDPEDEELFFSEEDFECEYYGLGDEQDIQDHLRGTKIA